MLKKNFAAAFLTGMTIALLSSSPARAGNNLYWGVDTASSPLWVTASSWYTDLAGTSVSVAAPTASDDVFFNTTTFNATAVSPKMNAAAAINSITFNSTAAVTLQSSSTTARDLTIGAGGVTVMSGAGLSTFGTSSATIGVRFGANQTWTNNASTTLTIRNNAASATGAGAVTLTLNAASTGTIGNSGSYNDGTGSTLAIIVASTGTGAVSLPGGTYSGGTTIKSGTITSTGNFGTGAILLGDTTGSANATLIANHATNTFANDITVQSGSTGNTLTISNNGGANTPIFSGNLTLNKAVTFNAGTGSITLTGGLSGIGNITVSGGSLAFNRGAASFTLANNIDGTGGLTQAGTGTLTLTGATGGTTTYTGATKVNAGTMKLDFNAVGAPATNIISASSALTLGNSTLNIKLSNGASANTQGFASTTFTGNTSSILNVTQNGNTNGASGITLGGITRGAGSTVDFTLPTTGTLASTTTSATGTNKVNGNGIAYSTVGATTWLTNNAGALGALAGGSYLVDTFTASGDTDIQANDAPSAFTINTLRFNTASKTLTLNSSGASTVTAGGILVTSAGTGSVITGSGSATLQPGATGKEVVIHNYADLTISAPIGNNGANATILTAAGTGTTILTGANTYTGTTNINTGATIQIGNAGTSGNLSASGAVSDNGTLVFNRTDTQTVANVISGTGAVTQAGTGTIKLSGLNTFTGIATLNANTTVQAANTNALGTGVLVLKNGTTLSSDSATARTLANSSFTFDGNTTLGDATNNGALTFSGNGTLTGNRALAINSAVTISGVIGDGGGTFGLTKNGSGTLTVSGINTYGGATVINSGTYQISTNATAGSANSDFTVNSGGTFYLNNSGQTGAVRAKSVTLNGGTILQTLANDVKENVTNALTSASGSSVITQVNASAKFSFLTFGSFARTAGSTLLIRGEAEAGLKTQVIFTTAPSGAQLVNSALLGSFINAVSSAADATDISTYNGTSVAAVTSTSQGANASFTGGATTNYKFTGAIGQTATANANSVNLGTGSSINGAQTLNVTSGMILATDDTNIGGTTAGTLAFGSAEGIVYVSGLTGAGKTLTIGSVITGSNATNGLTFTGGVNGAGTLVLNGANTYTGDTIINAGTLTLGNSLALQNSTLNYNNQGSTSTLSFGTLTTATLGSLKGSQSLALNNTIPTAVALTVGNNNAVNDTYAGVLSGNGSLTKVGTGIQTLSGVNTYTGATTITTGTLQVDGSTAADSTVDVGTAGSLTGSGAVNGNTTLTGSGVINKSSGIIAGTLAVTGGNWNGSGSVTGATNSSSDTFTIGNSANLTANGGLNVTGGTLAAGNSASTITGSVNYTSSSSSNFGGVIAGNGKTLIMNNGASILTLSGTNTYGGATTVSGGKLTIASTGSINSSSGVSIAGGNFNYNSSTPLTPAITFSGTGGALGGSGTVGAFTLTSGNTISPGNSPGTLTTGAETWMPGGTYAWEINNATGVQGTNWDFLSGTGSLDISALLSSAKFNVNVIGLTAGNVSGAVANWTDANASWKIASFTSIAGTFASNIFNVDASGFTNNNTAGGAFSVTNIGNDIYLTYTAAAIPEPSSYVLLGGFGTLLFALGYRRRARRAPAA